MRQKVLYQSAAALVGKGERVLHLVYMSRAQPSLYPMIAAIAVLGFGLAWIVGIDSWTSRIVVGLAAATIAMIVKVDYRVLVATHDDVVMMQGGRWRQVAKSVIGPLGPNTRVELLSNNLVMTQWEVDDDHYSVMKRFQSDMVSIAERFAAPD